MIAATGRLSPHSFGIAIDLNARFGDALVDHFTYVLASDGDLMEGVSQEAIALAGHLKLGRLIVLWDDNGISIDGPLSIADSVDQRKRFEAAGWATDAVDGHDQSAILAAVETVMPKQRSTLDAAALCKMADRGQIAGALLDYLAFKYGSR